MDFGRKEIMLLNFQADVWDLLEQYKKKAKGQKKAKRTTRPSCTVIIKFLEEQKDILIGHNTWHEYRAMAFKMLKNYRLNYHVLPGSSTLVPGHTIGMSSYAGTIASLDDFYLTSAGLASTETTLFVYNKELYGNLSHEDVVYEPIRVSVANRLSQFGSQWAKIFEKHNRYF